jgi:hypothetical protein
MLQLVTNLKRTDDQAHPYQKGMTYGDLGISQWGDFFSLLRGYHQRD